MQKTILITGSTDGIGLETAKMLLSQGHNILIHGRTPAKVHSTLQLLSEQIETDNLSNNIQGYIADLSDMEQLEKLAEEIKTNHHKLDVLINNAGVFRTPDPITTSGLDVRFAVNTVAPYLLTLQLLPLLGTEGRIINLSSAAQAPVDLEALTGKIYLENEFQAYAQSKLAITMWSRELGLALTDGPVVIAVNPGSMLGSKMVQEGFGVAGGDLSIGAKILSQLALEDEFKNASGKYFDNDSGKFTEPHKDALNREKSEAVIKAVEGILCLSFIAK
ncbi:SDR family NAD(P)-dependent oxidoreductase [Neptuniibacter sp.]|uniref:SDR family NAD(P)-dependent oxidoreductase n=1 Tax=Neptuniibacter sp. TaxID=1962643 RepID=UPI002617D166|nr:SDR family NAD(P)-dependent oxidoreductase [Neptuniibacter sp.]MCP4596093.1 SDR family NAD(P)-dependent oxidoreductase [Neptuniibacter sp.]